MQEPFRNKTCTRKNSGANRLAHLPTCAYNCLAHQSVSTRQGLRPRDRAADISFPSQVRTTSKRKTQANTNGDCVRGPTEPDFETPLRNRAVERNTFSSMLPRATRLHVGLEPHEVWYLYDCHGNKRRNTVQISAVQYGSRLRFHPPQFGVYDLS